MGTKTPASPWGITVSGDRIDWNAIRDRIDLARVATALLVRPRPPRGRWPPPLVEMPVPRRQEPLVLRRARPPWWRCFGCGEHGDAAEARHEAEQGGIPRGRADHCRSVRDRGPLGRKPPTATASKTDRQQTREARQPAARGTVWLTLGRASTLVTEAAGCLWTPEGAKALAYLRGRGLNDETIKAARLGVTPGVMIPTREGDRCYQARGVVIPWFDEDRLALVKIRQPEGRKPKYAEAFRDRPRVYPDPAVIEPGRPLVICEGELDALLLAQALGDLAVVVTLGSASTRPNPSTLGVMLAAAPWFIATDADEAGDKAASGWPARATRVRPPKGKDWTEAAQAGIDLRRWWSDHLGGTEVPAPSEERVFVASGIDGIMTVQSQTALPSEGQPGPEPRLPYWTAPNLDDDDVAALEAILSVPAGTPWPPLGGIIEEGYRHNATVLANLERKTRP